MHVDRPLHSGTSRLPFSTQRQMTRKDLLLHNQAARAARKKLPVQEKMEAEKLRREERDRTKEARKRSKSR